MRRLSDYSPPKIKNWRFYKTGALNNEQILQKYFTILSKLRAAILVLTNVLLRLELS